jgi:hypothetical protein
MAWISLKKYWKNYTGRMQKRSWSMIDEEHALDSVYCRR